MIYLISLKAIICKALLLFGKYSVWKIIPAEPAISFGYAYTDVGSSDK